MVYFLGKPSSILVFSTQYLYLWILLDLLKFAPTIYSPQITPKMYKMHVRIDEIHIY